MYIKTAPTCFGSVVWLQPHHRTNYNDVF